MMVKKAVEMNDIIRFASMWNLDGLVLIGYCERDYCYLRDHMRIPFVVYDGYQVESDRVCNITIVPMEKEKRDAFYLEQLDELKSYSAVFAVSDYYAVDFMKFLQSHDISVPKDISVAGFDDSFLCTLVSPTLTSIRQDNELRAQTALAKLRELNGEKEIRLPVMLVERESACRNF